MADKKVFDISHPEQTDLKPKKVMLQEPVAADAAGAPELSAADATSVSRRGMTIKPVGQPEEKVEAIESEITEQPVADAAPLPPSPIEEAIEEPKEAPAEIPKPGEQPTKEAPVEPEEAKEEPTPAETVTPVKESFGMTDLGLDDSQRASAAVKETMQDPKIYDTKAYYVPIGNTHHKHGHVAGAVLAGLLAAAAAVGAVFYITQGL